jgi:hypothetical protein
LSIAKFWIYFNTVVFIGLGLFTFIKPNAMASAMGYQLMNSTAMAELKANYGGLLCAIGFAILLAAIKLPLNITLGFISLLYLGYVCGRLTGVLVNGAYDKTTLLFLSIEVSSLLISSCLYWLKR